MNALNRNTLLAVPVSLPIYLGLPKQGVLWWDLFDAFVLAFSFTALGYLIELVLRRLPGIETGIGTVIRIAGWFVGGLWCYVLGRWALLAMGRDTGALPPLIWGGVFLVALELVLHVLQPTRRPRDVPQS